MPLNVRQDFNKSAVFYLDCALVLLAVDLTPNLHASQPVEMFGVLP